MSIIERKADDSESVVATERAESEEDEVERLDESVVDGDEGGADASEDEDSAK